jgi:hypothetical protein
LSCVAVWPATHTVTPPDVATPGENARDNWNGVFCMYSALCAAVESQGSTAVNDVTSDVVSKAAAVRVMWGLLRARGLRRVFSISGIASTRAVGPAVVSIVGRKKTR